MFKTNFSNISRKRIKVTHLKTKQVHNLAGKWVVSWKEKKPLSFSAAFSLWVTLWEWYQNGLLSYFYGKNPWASSFLIKLAWCQANIKHCIFDSVFSIVPVVLGEGSNLMVLLTVLQHWLCHEQYWHNISLCFSASLRKNLFDTI